MYLNSILTLGLIKLKNSNVRTNFGVLWLFLPFFTHIFLIGIVYRYIWRDDAFLPYFAYSYLFWRALVDPINELTHHWRANSDIYWNTNIDVTIVLFSDILSSFFRLLFFTSATLIFAGVFLGVLPKNLFLFLIALFSARFIGACVGIVWSFCTARIFDLTEVTQSIILLAYLLSPIFWRPERVPTDYFWFVAYNPIFHILEFCRSTVFESHEELSHLFVGTLFVTTAFFAAILIKYFSREAISWTQ